MALYRFEGDEAEVDRLRDEDADRSPDDRLDALGWDIYLLARHQDLPHFEAMRLAKPTQRNTVATRSALRTQLLHRQRPT
jgi:hypothetical protein